MYHMITEKICQLPKAQQPKAQQPRARLPGAHLPGAQPQSLPVYQRLVTPRGKQMEKNQKALRKVACQWGPWLESLLGS